MKLLHFEICLPEVPTNQGKNVNKRKLLDLFDVDEANLRNEMKK
jgi:hypothetical protein